MDVFTLMGWVTGVLGCFFVLTVILAFFGIPLLVLSTILLSARVKIEEINS
jgi:hypothetical protein